MTYGDVLLGAGDDELWVHGDAQLTGIADGGSGTDSLHLLEVTAFDMDQAFNFDIVNVSTSFTTALENVPTLPRLHVERGNLILRGDYEMAAGGKTAVTVHGDGAGGTVQVEGAGVLAGTLVIEPGRGAFRHGAEYTVLEAGSIDPDSAFAAFERPQTPLLDFDLIREDERFRIRADAKSFTEVAANAREMDIAERIDRLVRRAEGELADVIGSFQTADPSAYRAAFASFSADAYGHNAAAVRLLGSLASEAAMRHGVGAGFVETPGGASLAEYVRTFTNPTGAASGSGTAAGSGAAAGAAVNGRGWSGLWAERIHGMETSVLADGQGTARVAAEGFITGMTQAIGSRFSVGGGLAFLDGDVQASNAAGGARVSGSLAFVQGVWDAGPLYVSGSFVHGRQQGAAERRVAVGEFVRGAQGESEGVISVATVGVGRVFGTAGWRLHLFGNAAQTRQTESAFTETGVGNVGFEVDAYERTAVTGELGVGVRRTWHFDGWSLTPALGAAWHAVLGEQDGVRRAHFIGIPDESMLVPSSRLASGLRLEALLTVAFDDDRFRLVLGWKSGSGHATGPGLGGSAGPGASAGLGASAGPGASGSGSGLLDDGTYYGGISIRF